MRNAPSQPVTLDYYLKPANQHAKASLRWAVLAVVLFLVIVLEIYEIFFLQQPSFTIKSVTAVITIGLYLLGFCSAYAYTRRTFDINCLEIDWFGLFPGILYLTAGSLVAARLKIQLPEFTAVVFYWGCGFLTSPGLRGQKVVWALGLSAMTSLYQIFSGLGTK